LHFSGGGGKEHKGNLLGALTKKLAGGKKLGRKAGVIKLKGAKGGTQTSQLLNLGEIEKRDKDQKPLLIEGEK